MIYTDSEFLNSIALFFYDYLPDVLDLNLTASVVILFVICVRQFLKGAPKIFSYALWSIVLLRLLVPVSIESPMSFVPERTEFTSMVDVNDALPEIEFQTAQNRLDNKRQMETTAPGEPMVLSHSILEPQHYLTMIWIAGMLFLSVRSLLAYLGLKERVKVSVLLEKGIYIADDIDTPFVMGFFRPKIYLPGTLDPTEQKYIIAHEQHHIRRGDHIFKALSFLALTIHWFNPFVWAAFILSGRDMEMSCDEAVIRKLGEDVRAEYSASLLNLATGRRMFSGTPLAFDEGDPTERVRNLARWKKPAFWVVLICMLLCVVLAVCLLTDPETDVYQGSVSFVDLETYSVTMVELKNLHNGWYTYLTEPSDINAVCDFLKQLSGDCIGSSKGYYEGTYSVRLLSVGEEIFSISFGDSNTFYYGEGHDGYSVRYTPSEIDINEIVAFLSIYDNSPFHWDFLKDMELSQTADWGVSLKPDRVSRTGATALFVYGGSVPGQEGAELTYGDFLSLDRLVDGEWVPVDELAGYDYYLGDSSYPVVDGYGMVHEWPDRFGELVDGTYRIGKSVRLTRPDGSWEERMIFGEFSIPDSVRTGPIPLEELPEKYGAEQAAIDGCLVCPDGIARDNIEQFREFADACNRGEAGFFRVMYYYYGDDPHYIVHDIHYDGNKYTVNGMTSGDGRISVFEFPYLKHFTGTKEREEYPYDAYEYYCFVGDADITWQEIFDGLYDGKYMPILLNHIYYPKYPDIPDNPDYASLAFKDISLVTVLDGERLEKLIWLFESAEYLGYEPKTHSIGVGLNLTFTYANEEFIIELDPDSDLCRINGEYVWYGRADEPEYTFKLWEYLGITQWPDIVYMVCENALKP